MPNLTISDLVQLGNSLAEQQTNRVQPNNTQQTTHGVDYRAICQFLEYEILELYAKNPNNPVVKDFVLNITNKLQQNLQR